MNAKKLKSYLELQKLIGRNFRESDKHQSTVVWGNMGSPMMIFSGFDEAIIPIYPQIRNMLQGAGHIAKALQVATCQGYNTDLCSDLRCEIGNQHVLDGLRGALPRPDFIVGMNFTCNSSVGLYNNWVQQYPDAVHYIIDCPYSNGDSVGQETVQYVKSQFLELIAEIERTAGLRFDIEKFRGAARRMAQSMKLMNEIIMLARHNPSPICLTSFQPYLIPVSYYPHYDSTVEFLISLKKELEEIVETGTEKKERIRLCWDFLPLYKFMNDVHALLKEHDAKIVIGTSLTPAMEWPEPELFDTTDDPLGLLAYAFVQHHFKRDYKYWAKNISSWVSELNINGVIFHSARNCKAHSLTHFMVKEELERDLGVATMCFEADVLDPAAYSKSQVMNRLEAFLETF